MARKTNLEDARESLARAEADLEAFKATPEYTKAISYRNERKAAEEASEKLSEKEQEVYERVGVRLGVFNTERGWTKEFQAAVSKAFDMTPQTTVPRPGHRKPMGVYYDVVGRVGGMIITMDAEWQAAHAEHKAAQEASAVFWHQRYAEDRDLSRYENAIQSAKWAVQEEEEKRRAYERRRNEQKALKEALKTDAELREDAERAKAREKKILDFLKDGNPPEEVVKAFAPKGAQ